MKSEDPLLVAWDKTLSRKGDQPAIFNPTGQIARTFRQIEERARQFDAKIERFRAGEVIAVQIGNHENWPSIFVACLRKQLVVVPVEQSTSDEQRDAALQICRASAVVSAVPSGTSPKILRLRTADTTAEPSKAYLRHNGSAACNSISQSPATGRLQSDLRYDGN